MNLYDPATQYGLYGLLEGTDRQSNGNTFFVDSTVGSNTAGGTWGQSWTTPYATVNYAVSKCTTGAGDVILVAAAHAETLTAASTASGSTTGQLCIDKGDVSIIGMGRGTKRPTFTLSTAAGAGIDFVGTSPNVLLANLLFISSYTGGVTSAITIPANCYGTTIENCEFREGANTTEMLICIDIAAACEDVVIRGCRFVGVDGGSDTSCISMLGAAPRIQIVDNFLIGDWSDSCIEGSVAASLGVRIEDNVIDNLDPTAGLAINLHAGTTGAVIGNIMHGGLDGTSPLAVTACLVAQNYYTNAEAASAAILTPGTDS